MAYHFTKSHWNSTLACGKPVGISSCRDQQRSWGGMKILINSLGDTSFGLPASKLRWLDQNCSEANLANYIILNESYISLEINKNGAKIRWRPSVVSDRAYAALLYLLLDEAPRRLIVESYFKRQWSTNIISDPIPENLYQLSRSLNRGKLAKTLAFIVAESHWPN